METDGAKCMCARSYVEVEGKMFNDAIHGSISIHPLCVQIIDTPQFQRLRFLKMVGSCYFVFPAAAHNRFEHSLGVCYLAGKLVRAIQSRQPELNINSEDVLSVEVAGLCHDLGHGPFSHLWEEFVEMSPRKEKWTHEEASEKMFDYLIEANNLSEYFNKYDLDIQFIKKLICGLTESERQKNEKAFLYEIVANKRTGVDVDKWDYFLRDGHNLGIRVKFDYHRLVKYSRVIQVDGEWQICMRDKECNNLYDMFHARETLHRTAYQHRVVKIIDSITNYALRNVCDDMSAYTNLIDDIFHRILLAKGDHPDLVKAKEILENILKRRLYIYVGQTEPNDEISQEKLLDTISSNIPEESSLEREELGIQKVRFNYGLGEKNPIEYIRFYSKNSPNEARKIQEEEISSMLPQRFQERRFRLIYKSNKEKDFNDAQKAFKNACKQLNMNAPSLADFPIHLQSS
nr:deoxynucleoside triphosphate triphosphohydrolase SAMHD1-like isoform X2 [Cherax quadricarinatus]